MQRDDPLKKNRFGACDVLDGLAGHGIRQEADEIAGMPRFERDTDFAIGLEAADAGAMTRARIDDDERTACRIDFDPLWRDDPHETGIYRPIKSLSPADPFPFAID